MDTKTKSINFTLALAFASISLFSLSNTNPYKNEGKKPGETEKTIKEYFKFPSVLIPTLESLKESNIKIEVLFATDKNGNVNFALAKTNNLKLKNEIEKQFLGLHLEKVKQDVVHSITLNFRLI